MARAPVSTQRKYERPQPMTWRKHCLQMIEQLPIGAAVVLPDGKMLAVG